MLLLRVEISACKFGCFLWSLLWIKSAHGSFDCRIVSPFLPQAVTSTWTVGASAPISSPPVISAEGGALSFLLPVVESLHWARWRQERLEKIRWFGFQPTLPVPLSRKRVEGWLCVHNTSLFLAIHHPLLSSHRTRWASVMARKTGACTASREWLIAEQSGEQQSKVDAAYTVRRPRLPPVGPAGQIRDEWHAPIHFNSSNATNVILSPLNQTTW